jgi:hypothetical protein
MLFFQMGSVMTQNFFSNAGAGVCLQHYSPEPVESYLKPGFLFYCGSTLWLYSARPVY